MEVTKLEPQFYPCKPPKQAASAIQGLAVYTCQYHGWPGHFFAPLSLAHGSPTCSVCVCLLGRVW